MSRAEPLPSPQRLAPVFAALGDRTRLSLVGQLSGGEARSIAGLSVGAAMTRQAVTKHLRVLESAGLVTRAEVGRESRYRLRAEPIAELQTYLNDVSAQWDETLGRLKAFVEG